MQKGTKNKKIQNYEKYFKITQNLIKIQNFKKYQKN